MREPDPPSVPWNVKALVAEFATPTGAPWDEVIGDLWRDRSSSQRVRALVGDFAFRERVVIPVQARRENGGRTLRIVDGVHRIAAAWALMLPVPVHIIEGEL